jgi:hypothetical protein
MQLAERSIKVKSRSDRIFLHIMSDLHIGSAQCDEEEIVKCLKAGGGREHHYYLFCGDIIDCIGHKDKRFHPSKLHRQFVGIDDIIGSEIEYAAELVKKHLEPGQVLGILDGNHERKSLEYCSFHPIRRIVEMVNGYTTGIPPAQYLGYHCLYRLMIRRGKSATAASFIIHAHHGWGGGGRTAGGSITKYDRHAMQYSADIHCYGHSHDPGLKPIVQDVSIMRTRLELEIRNSWLICCPAFQKTLSQPGETEPWAETMGFPLRPMGGVVMEIDVDWDMGKTKAIMPTF